MDQREILSKNKILMLIFRLNKIKIKEGCGINSDYGFSIDDDQKLKIFD
jgi:hypothetical protein